MKRRHTKRDLVRIFKERGLRANRLLGQHFLVDHNVLEFICKAGAVSEGDAVLEIGAGTGLLTWHLAQTGARVLAVEIDGELFDIARDYVGGAGNVVLVRADIHGERRRLHPEVEAALRQTVGPGETFKVVSNLPYCISSDLLVTLLEMEGRVSMMVLTVQKEFAARLVARPGSRDYGALTVLLRAQAKVKRLRSLAPSVFWPVPNVESAIVEIVPDAERAARISDYGLLRSTVNALFSQRRKTAAKALASTPRGRQSKQRIAEALRAAGVPPAARPGAIPIPKIVALANALAAGPP